jgi:hypothetical protein
MWKKVEGDIRLKYVPTKLVCESPLVVIRIN